MKLKHIRHGFRFGVMRLQQRMRCGATVKTQKSDSFGRTLHTLVQNFRPTKILEIGSGNGCGSTASLLRKMNYRPEFVDCVESCPKHVSIIRDLIIPRFPFVRAHACLPISYSDWSFKSFLKDFWQPLSKYQRNLLQKDSCYRSWLELERMLCLADGPSYLKTHPELTYDLVVLNGCDFSTFDECRLLQGRFKVIAIANVLGTPKFNSVFQTLVQDPMLELITASNLAHSDYAVFRRRQETLNL